MSGKQSQGLLCNHSLRLFVARSSLSHIQVLRDIPTSMSKRASSYESCLQFLGIWIREIRERMGSRLRQGNALLALVLATPVLVGGFAFFIGFEKQHLRHSLVSVDLGG